MLYFLRIILEFLSIAACVHTLDLQEQDDKLVEWTSGYNNDQFSEGEEDIRVTSDSTEPSDLDKAAYDQDIPLLQNSVRALRPSQKTDDHFF